MASHTTDGNPRPMAPPEPPVASAHDGAIILSLVGGQQPSTLPGWTLVTVTPSRFRTRLSRVEARTGGLQSSVL